MFKDGAGKLSTYRFDNIAVKIAMTRSAQADAAAGFVPMDATSLRERRNELFRQARERRDGEI